MTVHPWAFSLDKFKEISKQLLYNKFFFVIFLHLSLLADKNKCDNDFTNY